MTKRKLFLLAAASALSLCSTALYADISDCGLNFLHCAYTTQSNDQPGKYAYMVFTNGNRQPLGCINNWAYPVSSDNDPRWLLRTHTWKIYQCKDSTCKTSEAKLIATDTFSVSCPGKDCEKNGFVVKPHAKYPFSLLESYGQTCNAGSTIR